MIREIHNFIIDAGEKHPIAADVLYRENDKKKPVVVFCHGFKGFKDWGHFDLLAKKFAENDLVFVKFNFSHNGTVPDRPKEFTDLEAFGNNNPLRELEDVKKVMDWVQNNEMIPASELDTERFYIIGHSRGGGIAILCAAEDKRVRKLVTWAAVNTFYDRWPSEDIAACREQGVVYIDNARTRQKMPIYGQFIEVLERNRERLNISEAVKNRIYIPFLAVHGAADETVSEEEAREMKRWNPQIELLLIEGANHTFGGKHPYESQSLPLHSEKLAEETIRFLKR